MSLALLGIGILPQAALADLTITPTINTTNLNTSLTGQDVNISNITINQGSQTGQVGTFTGGSSGGAGPLLGIENGVILTTGNVTSADGPNRYSSRTTGGESGPTDSQLATIDSGSQWDTVALQFNVVPNGNTLSVKFAFASEEYNEYVCTTFNDAMGIFVSGPGIIGSVNIARLDKNLANFSINQINRGVAGAASSFAPAPCDLSNSAYFVNNIAVYNEDTSNTNAPTPLGISTSYTNVEYDGFTIPLDAQVQVQPGGTYTVKVITADIGDALWDGAVFIDSVSSYNLDFGDAPNSYGTTIIDQAIQLPGPARHSTGTSTVYLGATPPDAEGNGTPATSPNAANGDDSSGDDEDAFNSDLVVASGETSHTINNIPVHNSSDQTAQLMGWIDFNQDGDFLDPGEQAVVNVSPGQTTANLSWSGYTAPTTGTTYARFRITTDASLIANPSPLGLAADGEVEDYHVTIAALDFGDAPNTYGTTAAINGARHAINGSIYLGTTAPDSETDASTPLDGTGDGAQDDGVTMPASFQAGSTISLPVRVTGAGVLNAWIDWNRDGDFNDANEQIATNAADNGSGDTDATSNNIIQLSVTVPSGASIGSSYARFRYSSDVNLTPTGLASNGEVEDYQVEIVGNSNVVVVSDSQNFCTTSGGTLGANLFSNNGSFGTGSSTPGTTGSALPSGRTTYTFVNYGNSAPNDGQYSIVNQLNQTTFNYWFNPVSGHTTGLVDDQMLVVNAAFAPGTFYTETLTVPANQNMSFGFWLLNLPNPNSFGWTEYAGGTAGDPNASGGHIKPNISMYVNRLGIDDNNDGSVDEIGEGQLLTSTGDVPFTSAPTWVEYTTLFNTGNATSIEFRLVNNAPGGTGNDLALDDLFVATCNSLPVGNITGTLYRDANANNIYDGSVDPTMPANIAINLLDGNGTMVSTTFTDANGGYNFSNIPVGSNYTIAIVLTDPDIPDEATPTANPSGDSSTGLQTGITVMANTTLANQDFGFTALLDYGDAPNTYGTTAASNGARHAINGSIYLGTTAPDSENDASTPLDGTGDGTQDDGVTIPALFQAGSTISLPVQVTGAGVLNAWIDWNRDGEFNDANEQIATNAVDNGSEDLDGISNNIILLSVNVPSNASIGDSYARFRYSSETNLTPVGLASNGEVEDYPLTTVSSPNVLLVKRITAVNGLSLNPNDGITRLDQFVDDTTSSRQADDNASGWPAGYLIGAIDAGLVKPNDTLEYTIYFLSSGGGAAEDVRICDRLSPNLSFVTEGYGANQAVEFKLGTNAEQYFTAANDAGDRVELVGGGTGSPSNCNLQQSNSNGVLVFDITGGSGEPAITELPNSTGSGTPNNSYGLFRFKARVKE